MNNNLYKEELVALSWPHNFSSAYKFCLQNVTIHISINNPINAMKFANSFSTHTTTNYYIPSPLFHSRVHMLV